jgi:hypothetical protein
MRPPRQRRRGLIPSIAGPEGFTPDVPIPVQLARDEEIGVQTEDGMFEEEKMGALKVPPPAYGLWRCSVVSFLLQTWLKCRLTCLVLAYKSESTPLAASSRRELSNNERRRIKGIDRKLSHCYIAQCQLHRGDTTDATTAAQLH